MAPTKAKDEAVEKDNSSQTTPPPPVDEWERVAAGLGEQWDFAAQGDLIGTWTGAQVVDLKKPGLDGKTEATAYTFATDDGAPVFVWASYALTNALEKVGVGDRLKISHKGQRDFKNEDGNAQRVNVFEVFKSSAQASLYQAPDMPEDL